MEKNSVRHYSMYVHTTERNFTQLWGLFRLSPKIHLVVHTVISWGANFRCVFGQKDIWEIHEVV